MLLQCENQLFKKVLVKLIIFRPERFMVSHRTINTEDPRLVNFLRLHDRVNPVFLPFFQLSARLLRLNKLLLVFTEVLSADVFYFV